MHIKENIRHEQQNLILYIFYVTRNNVIKVLNN